MSTNFRRWNIGLRMFFRRSTTAKLGCVLLGVLFVYEIKTALYGSHTRLPREVKRPWARSDQPCQQPELEENNILMAPFFHKVAPFQCRSDRNLVCVKGSIASLCPWARTKDTVCLYTFFDRKTDHYNVDVETVEAKGADEIGLRTDFFRVQCRHKDVAKVSDVIWNNVMTGISRKSDVRARSDYQKLPKNAAQLNVLVLGFDSLSRMTFKRKMPKAYWYIEEVLGGVVLQGYNIVGDGTPQALIPMLTGMTERELPETRKRKFFSNYVDVYPFVWKDFRSHGYVTAFAEDMPRYSAFTYRLTGFNEQPTDHYLRPFYIGVEKVTANHPPWCLGDTPRHKVLMNWIEDFYDSYSTKPKFLFAFHGELSHDDINLIEAVDEDLVDFLQSLKRKGHLEKTLMIIMSDHGNRFATTRETLQGKYEERLPFFSITVPKFFKSKYPSAWINLKKNSQRLTSPFDIHPTLRSLLHFGGGGIGNLSHRGINLFDEVPLLRSCMDAGIEPHWCTCLNWGKISPNDSIASQAIAAVVDYINNLTSPHRKLCAPLHLQKVDSVERYAPSLGLLRFSKNADYDGFEGDFSANTDAKEEFYQMRFSTWPGDGHFEATLHYILSRKSFHVKDDFISRINSYGSDANCILEINADIRKFCHCI